MACVAAELRFQKQRFRFISPGYYLKLGKTNPILARGCGQQASLAGDFLGIRESLVQSTEYYSVEHKDDAISHGISASPRRNAEVHALHPSTRRIMVLSPDPLLGSR
jgi:hypothetical protein